MGKASELLPRWLVNHHVADAASPPPPLSPSPPSPPPPPAHLPLRAWDDGFTPSGCDARPTKIVSPQLKTHPQVFRVVDEAVHAATADLLYASAARATVWGVFVPTRELSVGRADVVVDVGVDVDVLRAQLQLEDEAAMDRENKKRHRTALARLAVEEFLVNQGDDVISADDWCRAAGVAVWVIASDCDDKTEYHLDYAEMLRYETNVIFPPIYGATLHVSPLANDDAVDAQDANTRVVDGGGFHVNTRGLDHYQQYGYKTRLAPAKLSTDDLEAKVHTEPGWQSVAYKYRRGIVCDGEFPHFSGRVRALPPSAKRVVVGFNLFPHEIGAFVEKFPEHSDAFNKYVKLSQTAAKQQAAQWSVESLRKNPRQAAFIKYLARKVREKQAQAQAQSEQAVVVDAASGAPSVIRAV